MRLWVWPGREFYRKLADAMEIPDSAPGIYRYSPGNPEQRLSVSGPIR